MSGLPSGHQHLRNSGTNLWRNVQQAGVNLATIQIAAGKRLLVRCQIEQESESFATKRNVPVNPRGDLSPGADPRELLMKLARVGEGLTTEGGNTYHRAERRMPMRCSTGRLPSAVSYRRASVDSWNTPASPDLSPARRQPRL